MRYPPGTIAISQKSDVPLLQLAYRAGHSTPRQLYEFLHARGLPDQVWKTFHWRVRRLVRHGFLDSEKVDGLGAVLSLGANGELLLQGREPLVVVERASRSAANNRRSQIWHDVDLFEIQLALRRAGVVRLWQFETEIRSQNDFTSYGYRKDYDAIVTFAVGERSAEVALEYERTAKSTRVYERICAELNRETRISTFLYLARSVQLQWFLLHGLRKTTQRLYVGMAAEFSQEPRTAPLIDVRRSLILRLEDCLTSAD